MKGKEQAGRLDYLLKEFKEDSRRYRDLEVGEDYEEKRIMRKRGWRSAP